MKIKFKDVVIKHNVGKRQFLKTIESAYHTAKKLGNDLEIECDKVVISENTFGFLDFTLYPNAMAWISIVSMK